MRMLVAYKSNIIEKENQLINQEKSYTVGVIKLTKKKVEQIYYPS